MKLSFLVALLATLMLRMETVRAQTLSGDTLRLSPKTLPVKCNTGDLRVNSVNSSLSYCITNTWSVIGGGGGSSGPNVTTGNVWYGNGNNTPSQNAFLFFDSAATAFSVGGNITAGGTFIGNIRGNGTGAWTGTASQAGTASFATTAAASGTASNAGTAAFAGQAGTASIATAFATTPNACAAGVWANAIGASGNLTCTQVTTASAAGTAGTASFATTATSSTTASAAGTASTSGTAAFSAVSGTASAATAFTSTPTACGANQYASGISPAGNLTCAQVSFAQVTGTAAVTQGGTGQASGTSGGILFFSGATSLTTSGVMTAGAVMLGGGAGASPTALSGTTAGQVLTWTGSAWNASAAASGGSAVQPTIQYYTATPSPVGLVFLLRNGANATIGAVYTASGASYTVTSTNVSASGLSTFLFASNSTTISMTGALTKVSGGGDTSLPYSMMQQYGNYTAPAGVNHIQVALIGGGGGGGGNSTTLANVPVAGNGGFSVFGFGTVVANGGNGGAPTINTPTPGGNCTAGQIQISGGPGQGATNNSGTTIPGSSGGNGAFGGGGWAGGPQGGNGNPGGTNTGGGGGSSGASGNPTLAGGGGGAGGYCKSVINSVPATAPIVVGMAGLFGANAGGGAGTAASGGAGNVQIIEYYNP